MADDKGKKLADLMFGQRMDEGGAAFGVFPQMKPRRSKQDPEAAKNVPVDVARGFAAGALGMPGDLEALIRMLPGLKEETVLPTSEDILKKIPFGSDTPAGRASSELGVLGGGFYTGPGSPFRAAVAVPKAVFKAGKDFVKSAGQSGSNIVPPDLARRLSTKVSIPDDEVFRQAVEGTPGASITDEGLMMALQRRQKMEQELAPSVRGGVFYLPEGSAQGKYYSKSSGLYGGSEKITGETTIANPLFVKGSTGGKAPEQAYIQLMGKDALKTLQDDLMGIVSSRAKGNERANVRAFLSKYAPELEDYADYIVDSSKQGNQLRYALQEAAIGSAARKAGHDAIVGYSKKRTGQPFISEVFDVREVNYPSKNIDPEVWEDFTQSPSKATGGAVRFTSNPDAMRLELEKPAIKPISKAMGGAITADDLIIEERPL